MEAYEKEQHEARALEGMLRKLEKENMRWEQKLAYLGESMPSGVVLREIAEESGEVRLEGTAQTPRPSGFSAMSSPLPGAVRRESGSGREIR